MKVLLLRPDEGDAIYNPRERSLCVDDSNSRVGVSMLKINLNL